MEYIRSMVMHRATGVLRADLTTEIITVMDGKTIPWNSIPIHEMYEKGFTQQVAQVTHFDYMEQDFFAKYASNDSSRGRNAGAESSNSNTADWHYTRAG